MTMNDNSSNMLVSDLIINDAKDIDAIIFDCDGVLVDITESYDTAINETVSYILKDILGIQADTIVTPEILYGFKSKGGFNDEVAVCYAVILSSFAANKKIVDVFSKIIQYPYPLNTLAIQCGILALEKSNKISSMFSLIKNERRKIIQNLRKTGTFDVFDSSANFVLFDAKGADSRVYNALIEQGISIRKLGKLGRHKGCLRVTVGTPEMNSKFLLAIRDLLE